MIRGWGSGLLLAIAPAAMAVAQDSAIVPGADAFTIRLNQTRITVERQANVACPPACVQPLLAAPGVPTLAELEVITFLQAEVATGAGLLIDLRDPSAFAIGSIPGAVNIPVAALSPENPYLSEILAAVGGVEQSGQWGFAAVQHLAFFGAGPDDPAPTKTITALIALGYPADHLRYYRGGMADWTGLGLSVVRPGEAG